MAEHNLTELLASWNAGDENALEILYPIIQPELRRIAHNYMRRENPNHTLQTTALINEAFIELREQHSVIWQNRAHFLALASTIMRRILLMHARKKLSEKRGGNQEHVDLENVQVLTDEKSIELIALDQALERLAQYDKLKSALSKCVFSGD